MLELRTKTFKEPLNISPEICASFEKPLTYYLRHKDDYFTFFFTFVIVDFQKKRLTYIVSYLPENLAKTVNHPKSDLFKAKSPNINPHCTILTKENEEFLVFFESTAFFFQVNYKNNTLKVYSEELLEKKADEYLLAFSPTNFKDDQDPNYFYFSALISNRATKENSLQFYRSSLDLSKIELIYTKPDILPQHPHAVRKIGKKIISSDFLTRSFKNLKTGKIFGDNLAYMTYVYESLYEEYCEKTGRVYSRQAFQKNNYLNIFLNKLELEPGFDSFCLSKGKNFLDICKRNPKYSFDPLPGSIMLLDLETKEEETLYTTACSPAHFEIDKKTGDIFVSSHNFDFFDKAFFLFLGPAAIDRFHLENGKFVKISTFSHPTGYRFTSHKIFSWEGRSYFCTFGQPNRLFFINAKTMQLEYFEDIGEDFLSNQTDITQYINRRSFIMPFEIVNMEVSNDGQFVFFVNHEYIHIYSFPERKLVQKIKHNEGTLPGSDISLSDFRVLTVHINYLL